MIFRTNFVIHNRSIPTQTLEKAQKYVDMQVIRLCNPYTPKDTGSLIRSAILGTVIGSGKVVYNCIYARKQYYEGKSNSMRGRRWFARMKADRRTEILKGLKNIVNGGG